uniref:Uncharacterized protein n=1 Tax=Rhizophora mucronata TaxID=61149 RepID=A0A2P2J500_RHIMU
MVYFGNIIRLTLFSG